jgi:hypothetical protein
MGNVMRIDPIPDTKPVTLEEGISLLEAGQGEGLVVDLGNGRTASADGHRGTDGLLQRLRGHRMMLSLATGGADLSRFEGLNVSVIVAPLVQEILDATGQKD